MHAKASGKVTRTTCKEGVRTRRSSSPSSKPPMAYRVRLMPRAERDLADIFSNIHADSSDAARAWYSRLRDTIRSLRDNPHRCPTTHEDERFRQLLYGKKPHVYRVIYHVNDTSKQIAVLHIRHGARSEFSLDQLQ